jgi:hypothetical protein
MLALAAAVVKTAFKIWMKDSDLATNTSDELIDLIKDKVVGSSGQRKVRRWVEDLEEIVSSRLLTYMEHEFTGIQDNERQATIFAVADTLSQARITEQILWEQDLDPLHLERLLRTAVPDADRDLGYQARGLYNHLLPEACAYVVSLTTSLPEFQVGAFGELLRRDTAIIARLDEILRLLPAQQTQTFGSGASDEVSNAFATAYRRQIVTRLDHMRLFGVDVFTQQYPLTLAYISLSVYDYRSSTHSQKRAARPDITYEIQDASVEWALSKSTRLFLRGQAGSGKTTILQWLAVRAARKDFPAPLTSWNNYEPFFIPLRRYVDRPLPSPSQFVEAVGRHITTEMPPDWVERKLASGSALILIDGIDELPAENYDAVKQWVNALIDDYPNCAYVITTRPGAVADSWLASSKFSSAVLAPMSSYSVMTFVHQWIESLRSESVDREERDLLGGYEQPIVRALLTTRHLRELAATPLLCALLCALYYIRNGELPADRMGVYAAAFDMLERRDTERGIKPDDLIGRAESRIILQDLAYWFIRNGLSDAPLDRVLQQIGMSKRYLHKVSADAISVYQQLLIRSGLLQEPTADRVSFIHRTFQEYLAARAAIDGDNLEELVDHALDTRWTQVVIMAAGHASPSQRQRLLGSLIKTTRRGRQDRLGLALVALACLETSPSVSSDLLQQIRKAASSVIPPRQREDVELLVKAGELALDILTYVTIKTSNEALMILEVICRVESERRLELMASVVHEMPSVAGLLGFRRVWRAFTPEDVSNVLLQLSEIESVYVELPRCQEVISLLTNVRTFYCAAYDVVADLSPFRALPQLRNLTILSTGVVNLVPLAGLANLTVRVILRHGLSESQLSSDELLQKYVVGVGELGAGSIVVAESQPYGRWSNGLPANANLD